MSGLIVVIGGQERRPRYRCMACDVVFYDGEERVYERHVVACSEVHDAELRAMSVRQRDPAIFDPQVSGDVELGQWIKRHREALLEDRKKL